MVPDSFRRFGFVPMTDKEIRACSYGGVKRIEDLYDPRAFGASRDLCCECGKYVGEEHAGIICDRCGVKIVRDSARTRSKRMGHIPLACPICHPFDNSVFLEVFPVAPIHRRRSGDGTVTPFGLRYEALVTANQLTAGALPERDSAEYLKAIFDFRPKALEQTIAELVGTRRKDTTEFDVDDLLSLTFRAFDHKDPDLAELICSCALVLRVEPAT